MGIYLVTWSSALLAWVLAYGRMRDLRIPEQILQNHCNNKTCPLARGDKLHHEFAAIDDKIVITSSFNWSPSAAHTKDEALLVIHSPQFAKHLTREMDRFGERAELGITPRIQRKIDRQKIRCRDRAMGR